MDLENDVVPESSVVECDTTAGKIVMQLYKEWSPLGYERAIELFQSSFYDGSHFFRVVHGFLVQFGISYMEDKQVQKFARSTIKDDPPIGIEFEEGIISFAGSGPNSRTSHLFIAYDAIPSLGKEPWETPIGKVIKGIENVRNLNGEYGDGAPHGKGPAQHMISSGGREYMEENFPNLDSFISCSVMYYTEDDGKDDGQVGKGDEDDEISNGEKMNEVEEKNPVKRDALGNPFEQHMKIGKRLGEGDSRGDSGFMIPIVSAVAAFVGILCIVKRRKRKNTKVG